MNDTNNDVFLYRFIKNHETELVYEIADRLGVIANKGHHVLLSVLPDASKYRLYIDRPITTLYSWSDEFDDAAISETWASPDATPTSIFTELLKCRESWDVPFPSQDDMQSIEPELKHAYSFTRYLESTARTKSLPYFSGVLINRIKTFRVESDNALKNIRELKQQKAGSNDSQIAQKLDEAIEDEEQLNRAILRGVDYATWQIWKIETQDND